MRHTNAKFYTQKKLFWLKGGIKVLGIEIHADAQVTINVNYMNALERVERVIQSWKHRKLSLLGKIAVINSLMTSQFMYKFMVLPDPDRIFLNFYKRIIVDFLWENKTPLVRYDKLVQSHQQGGLKLPDLEAKNLALKTKWVDYLRQKMLSGFMLTHKFKGNSYGGTISPQVM